MISIGELKDKKKEQHNFKSYADARSFLQYNGFKNVGYILEEPWKDFFIEKWQKENQIALLGNLVFIPPPKNAFLHPIDFMNKPYQVDIAEL